MGILIVWEAFVCICAERVSSFHEALRGPVPKRCLRITDPKKVIEVLGAVFIHPLNKTLVGTSSMPGMLKETDGNPGITMSMLRLRCNWKGGQSETTAGGQEEQCRWETAERGGEGLTSECGPRKGPAGRGPEHKKPAGGK